MSQRVRPEVAGPMTGSAKSGSGIEASRSFPDCASLIRATDASPLPGLSLQCRVSWHSFAIVIEMTGTSPVMTALLFDIVDRQRAQPQRRKARLYEQRL